MTLPPEWIPCLRMAGLLAFEITLAIAAALWLLHRTRSVLWQRTLWQGVTLGLLALCLAEISGFSETLRVWSRSWFQANTAPQSPGASSAPARRPQLTAQFKERVAQRLEANRLNAPTPAEKRGDLQPTVLTEASPDPAVEPFFQGRLMPWPELVWAVGTAATLAAIQLARLFFSLVLRRGRRRVSDPAILKQVAILARRLGLRRRVQVFESRRLNGPVAFGLWRLSIGLPEGFARTFSPQQLDVILAHELAHLAGRDPVWHALADGMAAALWWHPLAWWTRHRLRAVAESAADEASLLVTGGPGLLAECLLQLASRVATRQPLGWAGATGPGFRSGLGRRVERLLNLGGTWSPLQKIQSRAVKLGVPAALMAGAILGTAWAGPNANEEGMQTMTQTWKRSLATLALFTAVGSSEPNSPAAAPPPAPRPSGSEKSKLIERYGLQPTPAQPAQPDPAPTPVPPQPAIPAEDAEPPDQPQPPENSIYRMDPRLLRRYGLSPRQAPAASAPVPAQPKLSRGKQEIEARLNQILLNEILYDGVPLSEIVRDLKDQARRRDPAQQGLNFLISNVPEAGMPSGSVDPTTGMPIPVTQFNLGDTPIRLHLRNVRLKDVLDAMTRVAEQPIRYSIEDYGIVFSPGSGQPFMALPSPPIALQVRTFRVETNTFLPGLENAFGIYLSDRVDPAELRALEEKLNQAKLRVLEDETRKTTADTIKNQSAPATKEPASREQMEAQKEIRRLDHAYQEASQGRPDKARQTQLAVRQLLLQLGVNMDAPNKAVFYNDLTGILMVRATPEELELVQAAIETLGGKALRPGAFLSSPDTAPASGNSTRSVTW